MQLKKILGWSSLIVLLSCEKDITVDAPSRASKLVVNSVTAANMRFTATVGKTVGILDLTTPESYSVNNAVVLLYENNVVTDTLAFNPTTFSYEVKHNTVAKPGIRYQLKAAAPGFNTAEGETTVPDDIKIQSITRRVNVRVDADSNVYDEVKIRFVDDGATSNYYMVKFRRPFNDRREVYYEEMFCMRSLDTDIDRETGVNPNLFEDCIDRAFILADNHFNGAVKELIVFIRRHELESVISAFDNREYRAVAELNNITREQYRYWKSYGTYRDAEDNPFAEPVLVFSNIKNGHGLFGAYNLAIDTIR